jgi:catechol 2,3-dioxygenase-like lactoylglutathione lyase family enzyme
MRAVQKLHHFAWRCKDAELTRKFYEDVLGMALVHVIRADHVPSTGEYCPHVHIFFKMADGSFIAFFDLGDNTAALPSPNTPSWVNHLALEVDSVEALEIFRGRIQSNGVEVLGVIDHNFVQSIYFFDPNGLRVELTVRTGTPEHMADHARQAHARLNSWTAEKSSRPLTTSSLA